MKIDIKRKVSVSLRLTEEEAHVFSAGLYALARFEPQYPEDNEVKAFGDLRASVRDSLHTELGEAGLLPQEVRDGLDREPYYFPVETEEERSERQRRWRTNEPEKGFAGLCSEGREVLQQLLTWAWKHPDRWVHATCSRSHKEDERWLPHIDFLISIGRITPKTIDGQEGWIVPSAKEWRNIMREQAREGDCLVG